MGFIHQFTKLNIIPLSPRQTCRKYVVLQVSTHGYSQNQILVWKYPSLTQVAKLTGHSYRVLYLVSTHCVSTYFSLQQCRELTV